MSLQRSLAKDDATSAMDAADVGTWHWDGASGEVRFSAHAAVLLGCVAAHPADYPGFLALVHAEDRAEVDRAMSAACAEGGAYDVDFRARATSASETWLRARGRCYGGGTAPLAIRGIFLEDGGRKSAEAANNRLVAFIASSEDAIVGKALDGLVTSWNRGAELIFGYTAADMLGRTISILIPDGEPDESPQILARIIRGERIAHYETRRRRKDGIVIDISLSVSPINDSAGRLIGASKVSRDITAAKAAEAALREGEAHLRSILDTVPDAMVLIDAQGSIQSFSATAERLFGYTAAAVQGKNVSMLMPPSYAAQHDGYLAHYHATGEKRIIGNSRIVIGLRQDGSTFPMELFVGEAVGMKHPAFTGFIRDLTERHQTQQRLHDLQAELAHVSRFNAMGEMASTLAHELNQPLTAAASFLNGCRRLLDGAAPPDLATLRSGIEQAAAQALRAGQIIRRMREFVTRGNTERRQESLPRLIEEASALALIGARQTGVRVNFSFDAAPVFVMADKIQLQQVILNLMRNAIEAMQGGALRDLEISLRDSGGAMVEIAVADTGPGIAPDIASRLFEPFTSNKPEGMGVGLSVSRTIIEAHGGRIWHSANPNGGAVFHMTLPAIKPREDAGAQR
jgi:two-component system sensor kinase FixL